MTEEISEKSEEKAKKGLNLGIEILIFAFVIGFFLNIIGLVSELGLFLTLPTDVNISG